MTSERYLVGLIGAGIGTSLSPALHERAARRLGVRYSYEIIDIDKIGASPADVGELLTAARRLGFRGLNITHPCKQEVVKHLDDLAEEAAELGAVNTVVFENGRSLGHNTDRYGFGTNLARTLPGAALGRVLQVGAGGAGAAVASAMIRAGTRQLLLADADPRRSRALADRLNAEAIPLDAVAGLLPDVDGLINATPVGMEGHPGVPVDAGALRARTWVADVIYRPLETELIRAARGRGCPVVPGGGMVVYQAAEAFRLFTGHRPDGDKMFADFLELTGTGDA
ncbi:shikimate dehydrogenase [Actinoplanes sp. NPDC051411]|uniref:shikimate dehydrogenase n=1 Tax=Actinoplanes sp. NPDC051411 TaxID=3155522 RepID=UPI00343823FC